MCSGQSLGPKGKCQVGLKFAPNQPNAFSGSLVFDFMYGSNSGKTPLISLGGKIK
jgi:hypothetical protein